MKLFVFLIIASMMLLGLLYYENFIEEKPKYPVIVYQNNDGEDYGSGDI